MRKSRESPGLGSGLLAVIVFLAPPGWQLYERYTAVSSTTSTADEAANEAQAALRLADIEDARRRLQEELDALTGIGFQRFSDERFPRRYIAYPADVLPVGDPSPLRRAFWVGLDAAETLPRDAAVVFKGMLAGRLETVPLESRFARVQTLLDPGFRVLFRSGPTTGLLRGTGRRERTGGRLPLLEAQHLTPVGDLTPGAAVVAAGGDGIYPPGFLIGHVLDEESTEASALPLVRAALSPGDLREVTVLVDSARVKLEGFLEAER